MTGKQLKAFVAGLPDDAVIETRNHNSYRHEWETLDGEAIRAIMTPVLAVPDMEASEVES